MTQLAVGFAGLGRMGVPMAHRLATAGLLKGVYNRTHSKAAELAGTLGVLACESPQALASVCDVLVTMLADEQAVNKVCNGLADGLRPGAVVVEMSTIGPAPLPRLQALLRAQGGSLVDAPVSGSVSLAAKGELTLMVGGDRRDVDLVRPVLDTIGSRVFHLGPLGAGGTIKLAVNTVVCALNGALSEALVFAESAGIGRAETYEVFANSAIAAPFVHYRRQEFEQPGSVPVAFRLALAAKDLRLALALAGSLGHPLQLAEANLRVIEAAVTAGFGDDDVSAVAEYMRAEMHEDMPRAWGDGWQRNVNA